MRLQLRLARRRIAADQPPRVSWRRQAKLPPCQVQLGDHPTEARPRPPLISLQLREHMPPGRRVQHDGTSRIDVILIQGDARRLGVLLGPHCHATSAQLDPARLICLFAGEVRQRLQGRRRLFQQIRGLLWRARRGHRMQPHPRGVQFPSHQPLRRGRHVSQRFRQQRHTRFVQYQQRQPALARQRREQRRRVWTPQSRPQPIARQRPTDHMTLKAAWGRRRHDIPERLYLRKLRIIPLIAVSHRGQQQFVQREQRLVQIAQIHRARWQVQRIKADDERGVLEGPSGCLGVVSHSLEFEGSRPFTISTASPLIMSEREAGGNRGGLLGYDPQCDGMRGRIGGPRLHAQQSYAIVTLTL